MGTSYLLALALLAHQGKVTRTLMVEPSGDRLHVVVHVKVSGTDRRRVMFGILDGNRDGRLDGRERKRFEAMMLERGLEGLRLYAGTATVALEGVQVKSKVEESFEVMVHGTAPAGDRVAVETSPTAEPLDLVVLPGTRPPVSPSRGRVRGGTLKVRVGSGDKVAWAMSEGP